MFLRTIVDFLESFFYSIKGINLNLSEVNLGAIAQVFQFFGLFGPSSLSF
jgi:hypothetical protein